MKTSAFFKTCPICGAALDPGERCDCKEGAKKEAATSQARKATATPPPRSTTTRGHTVDSIAWHGLILKKGVYDMFTGKELLELYTKDGLLPSDLQAAIDRLFSRLDELERRRGA